MRVLVTGACGFIGSHVSEALLARGDVVVGVDNFNDFYDPKRKEENRALLERHPNFQLLRGTILDANLRTRMFELSAGGRADAPVDAPTAEPAASVPAPAAAPLPPSAPSPADPPALSAEPAPLQSVPDPSGSGQAGESDGGKRRWWKTG